MILNSRRLCVGMLFTIVVFASSPIWADVELPALFGSHMVLQQEKPVVIWGTAGSGEDIAVSIGNLSGSTTAGDDGTWKVKLGSLKAGGPHTVTVKGTNTVTLDDVMVGEVWVCSGQSNMAFPVAAANDPDLESLSATFPNIRLISVPQVASQKPLRDFNGRWERCTPQTVRNFSAVGYFFGRLLHQVLDVPVGLIDNAWGGSAAEAWVRRDVLEADDRYGPLVEKWDGIVKNYDHAKATADFEKRLAQWKEAAGKAKAAGKRPPNRPRRPRNPLNSNHRPANLYNGVLYPVVGYGIRGVIWYQGESNASRAYQYRHLFPLMIKTWRDDWGQGAFPFYWVQLADFQDEKPEPGESAWAELREAQTMTMAALPNTGEAVIIDLGEAHDIHPRDKQNVAKRLARWALARDYGIEIVYRSPLYKSHEVAGSTIVVAFDHVGGGLDTFDVRQPVGFAVAGEDRKFVWAQARIVGKDKVEVWSDAVKKPAAVRYAWASNPVCNMQNREHLPMTPFRTDDWPGVTINSDR